MPLFRNLDFSILLIKIVLNWIEIFPKLLRIPCFLLTGWEFSNGRWNLFSISYSFWNGHRVPNVQKCLLHAGLPFGIFWILKKLLSSFKLVMAICMQTFYILKIQKNFWFSNIFENLDLFWNSWCPNGPLNYFWTWHPWLWSEN